MDAEQRTPRHEFDTPELDRYNDDPAMRLLVFFVRFPVSKQRIYGVVPYVTALDGEPGFYALMHTAISSDVTRLVRGTPYEPEPWEMERWATVDRTDELDHLYRVMHNLPEMEWRYHWPK